MNDQLSDLERRLHLAVQTYLGEARLELAPAVIVADVLTRPQPRTVRSRRSLTLVVAASGAALVLAVILLPVLRPAVLPPAATATPPPASESPSPSPTSVPPSPTQTRPPTPTAKPTGTSLPSAFTLVFDGSQVDPFRLPQASLLPDVPFSATTQATRVREFAVDLRNVRSVTVIDADRAALTMETQTRFETAIWLADWTSGTISEWVRGARALDAWGAGSDAEVLIEEDVDGATRLRRLNVQTGEELARVEVPAPATAVYLSDRSVAVASGSSIGVWTAGGLDLKASALGDLGELSRVAAGQNLLAGSELLDPHSGTQVGVTMPFSYDAAVAPQGDRIVLLTGAGSYAQYRFEMHDAKTGEALKVGSTTFFDLAAPGPVILAWVTEDGIITRTHGGLFGVKPTTRVTSSAALGEGKDITSLISVNSSVYTNGGAMLITGDGFIRVVDWTNAPQ